MPGAAFAGRKGAPLASDTHSPRESGSERAPAPVFLLADLISEVAGEAEAAHQANLTGKPRGPVTGMGELDEILGGFLAPGVHLVQGPPGVAKTSFCLQAGADCECPCVFVTAEMRRIELMRRIIARKTNTYLGRFRGDLTGQQVQALALTAARRVPHLAIMDSTRAYAYPEDIIRVAGNLRDRFGAPFVLVILDSLQAWARAGAPGVPEYDRVSAAIDAASAVSSHLGGPVLCVSQMNRVGNREASKNAAGGMHSGKGSGDLEYACETLLELGSLSKRVDSDAIHDTVISVHKNRHGAAGGSVLLEFEGRLMDFRPRGQGRADAEADSLMKLMNGASVR